MRNRRVCLLQSLFKISAIFEAWLGELATALKEAPAVVLSAFKSMRHKQGKNCFVTFINDFSTGENPSPRSMNLTGFHTMVFSQG